MHMPHAGSSSIIHIFDNPEETARAVAGGFVRLAREAIDAHGRFSVALAGGSTPRRVYQLLASDEWRARVSWADVHIFFGDERCVPPADTASNYRMAYETLLAHVPVPPAHVYRMKGEDDAVAGARLYEDTLRAFFAGMQWPRFDLILLGMGDDGHTASLFPSTPALTEQSAWVVANPVKQLDATRLTLTAPAINHAAHVFLIVTGTSKAEPIRQAIDGVHNPRHLPVQLIRPHHSALEWFLDKASAATLKTT